VTLLDLGVRERIPDCVERALEIGLKLVGVGLNVLLFLLGAAVTYGYATGDLSLSVTMALYAAFVGVMAVFYVTGRMRGDEEQRVAALVTAGEFAVYGGFGVGIALLPSPVNQLVAWIGIVLAALVVVHYEWLTTRLGFEKVGEEVVA
jgi:O-antigen/teichoic acid export membrane protein